MLNVNEVSIAKDSVFKLRTYNVPQNTELKFKSSDISVAFVDQKGRITGISCGECVVTVTVQTKNHTPIDMCTCNVTVGPAAISIKFTKTEMVLSVGMKKLLKSIVSPLNTVESPLFYSSDKDIHNKLVGAESFDRTAEGIKKARSPREA